jgi:fructose-bisphosphate aldolase, class II
VTLATLDEVLRTAVEQGRGVGAFNVIQIEHAEAFVAAAERTGLPVVLQISQNTVAYHGALAPIALATKELAASASARCVLQLDHALSESLIEKAVTLGFTSVMFDGSTLDDTANRERTTAVVQRCHGAGVSVEAELGEIGGKEGVHTAGARTDPQEARRFAEQTGVDALAVAVGSSHAMTKQTAELDLELITKIKNAVPVPLVLHGSSGVPESTLTDAVRAGMVKINIATHLNRIFTAALSDFIAGNTGVVDTRKYLGVARTAVEAEAARLLRLLALR